MIRKFDFKTPGREEDDVETKLYTKADVNARKAAAGEVQASDSEDPVSEAITRALAAKRISVMWTVVQQGFVVRSTMLPGSMTAS